MRTEGVRKEAIDSYWFGTMVMDLGATNTVPPIKWCCYADSTIVMVEPC